MTQITKFPSFIALLIVLTAKPVEAEEQLTVVYGNAYPPFAWANENRKARGIQPAFVEAVLGKRLGLNIAHEACPWLRCQQMVKAGDKDAFFTVPTDARLSYTEASAQPFYTTHFVLHIWKSHPLQDFFKNVKSITELRQHPKLRTVYMLGSGWHGQNLKGFAATTVANSAKIGLFLSTRRADFYIEQAELFRFQLAKDVDTASRVLTLPHSLAQANWHLFIGKKSPWVKRLPEINQILSSLKKSGELDKIKSEIFLAHNVSPQNVNLKQDSKP